MDGVGYVTGIRQPLKRGWDTTFDVETPHVMEGYAYINPLAGLNPWRSQKCTGK